MIGVWALLVYLAVIICWTTLLKRNVGEAMIVGFLSVLPFLGSKALTAGWKALVDAASDEIVYATMMFVFMGYLLEKSGVLEKLIDILNSLLGGIKGGPAYVSTVGSAALGTVVHNQAAIAATVGSVTIPWMTRAKLKPQKAATIVAGNAGMGITFPFSASMFVLVGAKATADILHVNDLVLPLLIGGLWCVLHRLIVTWWIVRKSDMEGMAKADRLTIGEAMRRGWYTLFIFLAVAAPLVLTTGGIGSAVTKHIGADVNKQVSIIFWIPVFLIVAGLLMGLKRLPTSAKAWYDYLADSASRFTIVGITVLFAFAGANALAATGMAKQMTNLLTSMHLPAWALSILIGIIVIAVSAPLSASATMAAVGSVSVLALVSAGISPTTAAVAVLVFSSCEAAVPPGGAPLYVSCGIAEVNPLHTFKDMFIYYALPLMAMGVFISLGILPV